MKKQPQLVQRQRILLTLVHFLWLAILPQDYRSEGPCREEWFKPDMAYCDNAFHVMCSEFRLERGLCFGVTVYSPIQRSRMTAAMPGRMTEYSRGRKYLCSTWSLSTKGWKRTKYQIMSTTVPCVHDISQTSGLETIHFRKWESTQGCLDDASFMLKWRL